MGLVGLSLQLVARLKWLARFALSWSVEARVSDFIFLHLFTQVGRFGASNLISSSGLQKCSAGQTGRDNACL